MGKYVKSISKIEIWGVDFQMIFVVLGTQDKKFERLLKEVERLIMDGTIQEKVIVQAGTTTYKSEYMEIHKMIPMKQFLAYMEKCDYVITHGGVGTILDAMKHDKKIIAVPRLKMYGEHENDHQIQIIEKFENAEYLIGCHSVDDLQEAISKIETFEPKKCELGNQQMINLITNYIETTNPAKQKHRMLDIFYVVCATTLESIFYFLLSTKMKSIDAIAIGWLISYIFFITCRYEKHNYLFEIMWGLFLAITLLLWFNLYSDFYFIILMITIMASVITCASHNLFYQRREV